MRLSSEIDMNDGDGWDVLLFLCVFMILLRVEKREKEFPALSPTWKEW